MPPVQAVPAAVADVRDGPARALRRPRLRPRHVPKADAKGWDYPFIALRGEKHGSGLGVYRWVVEQTFALLRWFRRLRIRWEFRDDTHEAFLRLACGIICFRRLVNLGLC